MFNREKLRHTIEMWACRYGVTVHDSTLDDLSKEMEAFIEDALREQEITDGQAIAHLNKSGWMQRHDQAMSFDSLTAVVNGLMLDGNKSISVNIYPWKEDEMHGR